jgi:hypothetical protein
MCSCRPSRCVQSVLPLPWACMILAPLAKAASLCGFRFQLRWVETRKTDGRLGTGRDQHGSFLELQVPEKIGHIYKAVAERESLSIVELKSGTPHFHASSSSPPSPRDHQLPSTPPDAKRSRLVADGGSVGPATASGMTLRPGT